MNHRNIYYCVTAQLKITFLAVSIAFSLSQPYACVLECGLPYRPVKYGSMASNTLGSIEVVAWTSRYNGLPSLPSIVIVSPSMSINSRDKNKREYQVKLYYTTMQ